MREELTETMQEVADKLGNKTTVVSRDIFFQFHQLNEIAREERLENRKIQRREAQQWSSHRTMT